MTVLRTTLDEELLEELTLAHRARDYRNATAVRCRVHPKLLTKWLRAGQNDDDPESLYARLFVAFGAIEGEIRAELIEQIADPTVETTAFDEGKPSSTVKRRTAGLQWLLERRFRQYRSDYAQKPDERDIAEMLTDEQAEALTVEAALAIAQAMAARMPAQLRPVFEGQGWEQLTAAERKALDAFRSKRKKTDA